MHIKILDNKSHQVFYGASVVYLLQPLAPIIANELGHLKVDEMLCYA